MKWDDGLEKDSQHFGIASSDGKFVLVRAGPGTGKTFAMMRKIGRLLEAEKVHPSKILAVSFTRTAANDLIEQLDNLGIDGASDVKASTLHSLAFQILGKNNCFELTGRNPRPLLDFEKKCLISDISKDHGGIKKCGKLLNAFESYWARLQHEIPGWTEDENEQLFQKNLTHWLEYHESMLIGELIPKTLDFLRSNPEIAKEYYFEYVLVDEYQDLNKAEQEFIEIISKKGNLTVIGDENQSIFSFKHANPEGILEFSNTHNNTENHELHECKRCPKLVLKFAENLIINNSDVTNYPFFCPETHINGDIHLVQHISSDEEIDNIANFIKYSLENDESLSSRDILVLSPRRQIGYGIRDKLNSMGFISQSYYSEECLDNDSSKEGMCLLKLLVNPDDRTALRSWLGIGKSNYRTPAYLRLKKLAKNNNLSPKEALEKILSSKLEFKTQRSDIIERYIILRDKLGTYNGEIKEELIDYLWREKIDCNQIREIAFSIINECESVEDFSSRLVMTISQPKLPDEDIIRVMSVHKSKGLTAKFVILAGCINGIIPNIEKDVTPEERIKKLEEQRRLFYVALTRTKKTLVLSNFISMSPISKAKRMNIPISNWYHNGRGGVASFQSSMFLTEIQPSQMVETISGAEWKNKIGF